MANALLIRWGAALVLVLVTFNPTSLNYVRWAQANYSEKLPVVALTGVLLLVGYVVFVRATLRSIGTIGIGLIAALVLALLWVFWDWGWLSLENPTVLTWVGLIALSFVMGVGLTWSIIRRRISGQLDVDDVDTDT